MKRFTYLLFLTIIAIISIECRTSAASSTQARFSGTGIITGADQVEKYLPYLKGKRIGLVANQSSLIGGKSSVDSLISLGVNIVKVFGPEHGFRGNASNGLKGGSAEG